jgi:hypothetical protein
VIGAPPVEAGAVKAIDIPSSVAVIALIVGTPGLPMRVTVVCDEETAV